MGPVDSPQQVEKQKLSFDNSKGGRNDSVFGNDLGFAGSPLQQRRSIPAEAPAQPALARNNVSTNSVQGSPVVTLKKPAPAANPPPAAPKAPLQHGDYYTKPDLDDLVKYGYQDLTTLSNFVVGRVGYGEVAFLAPVDLTSVPAIRDIPGGIVLFAEKMCEVYPDNVVKAPRGTGLNVPARITLHKCWPVDKASREPIKDIANPRMKQHLRILKGMAETEFVSYEAEPGTWVFKVQHFSKYGLLEDSDEESEADAAGQQEKAATTPPSHAPAKKRVSISPSVDSMSDSDRSSEDDDSMTEATDEDGSPSMSVDSRSSEEEDATSVDARPPWGAAVGAEPRKVQVMQASFFGSGERRAADVTPRPSRLQPAKRQLPFQHSSLADSELLSQNTNTIPYRAIQVRVRRSRFFLRSLSLTHRASFSTATLPRLRLQLSPKPGPPVCSPGPQRRPPSSQP